MKEQGLSPDRAGISPIWAWAQYDGVHHKRPDLRSSGYLPKGTPGVLIEIEKPAKDILLSDFSLWHYVLNNWYLPETMAKDNEQATDDEKRKSWERIFDLSFCPEDIADPLDKKRLQATFWTIQPSEVVRTQHFIAR